MTRDELIEYLNSLDFLSHIQYSDSCMDGTDDYLLTDTMFVFRVGISHPTKCLWYGISRWKDSKGFEKTQIYHHTAGMVESIYFKRFIDLIEDVPSHIGIELLFDLDVFDDTRNFTN